MNKKKVFWEAIVFVAMTICYYMCMPSPLYNFGAASVFQAFLIALCVENIFVSYFVLAYIVSYVLCLIVCCILAIKGRSLPTVIALFSDILISTAYFIVLAYASYIPDTLPIEILGYIFRIIFSAYVFAQHKKRKNAIKINA